MPTPNGASDVRISSSDVAIASSEFPRNCSRVFRVDIDLPATQCLPENDRAAHALAMFRRYARVLSDRLAISPRTYDSVNFFEPTTTSAAEEE